MAEGDDDKEADVTKPQKRPPDYVPLKLIIKRKRPDAETPPNPTLSPPKVKKHKRIKVNGIKYLKNVKLPSKYAGLAELAKAFEKEQVCSYLFQYNCDLVVESTLIHFFLHTAQMSPRSVAQQLPKVVGGG